MSADVATRAKATAADSPANLQERLAKANWPNRDFSLGVTAGGIDWHVQRLGQGPVCVLLHGTGASTHSYAKLAPQLAHRFTVIVPDLPGHGFTATPEAQGLTLPGMAALVGALLEKLGAKPQLIVGNSAGAAVACRMVLDQRAETPLIVSINGALLAFPGMARTIVPAIARLVFLNPVVPKLFAWRAQNQRAVDQVIEGTGSKIDPQSLQHYATLFRNEAHVAATLRMMAQWDLAGLERDLPGLKSHLALIATGEDRAITPSMAFQLRDKVPGSEVVFLRGLGHLAHEERPDLIADVITGLVDASGHEPAAGAPNSTIGPA